MCIVHRGGSEEEETTIRKFQIVQTECPRQVNREVTAEITKAHAESEFEKYRIVQDRLFKSDFDKLVEITEKD